MKARYICPALAAMLAFCALAGNEPNSQTPSNRETQELRVQIDELQTRVKMLEERLGRLESKEERTDRRPAPAPLNPTPLEMPKPPPAFMEEFPQGPSRPKIWGERQINGWTFYLIPCAPGSPASFGPNPSNFK